MKQTLVAAGLALLVVAGFWSWVAYRGKEQRLEISGNVLSVRSQQLDPATTLVIADYRVRNTSPQKLVVRSVELTLESKGKKLTGEYVSDVDLGRLLDYYKQLGPKTSAPLAHKSTLDAGATLDRMVAVSFPVSQAELAERSSLRVVVKDMDGDTFELPESR